MAIQKPTHERLQQAVADAISETADWTPNAIFPELHIEVFELDSLDLITVINRVEEELNADIDEGDIDSSVQKMTVAEFTKWIYDRITLK